MASTDAMERPDSWLPSRDPTPTKGCFVSSRGVVASSDSARQVASATAATKPVVASFWGNKRRYQAG